MIIVKLKGGLGNQMFQYAVGRMVSEKHKTPLRFDTSQFEHSLVERLKGNPHREYALGVFGINKDVVNSRYYTLLSLLSSSRLPAIVQNLKNIVSSHSLDLVQEIPFQLTNNLSRLDKVSFDKASGVYLNGYWQSEEYFNNIQDSIRYEFVFKPDLDTKNTVLAQEILRTNSVSIHVRRSDYVSNTRTNKYHGVCSVEYYQKAIALIIKKIKKPHFFVFSDDIEWARQNIVSDNPLLIVDHNIGTNHYYDDMRLMSYCKHNIIANSSFSWWGAWLNGNSQKIVVAPTPWFEFSVDNQKIVPSSWIRIAK